MLGRIEGLETGVAPSRSPPRQGVPVAAAPQVSFADAAPGISAMQCAGAVLSNAPGWGPGGQSPRPMSVASASTVPCTGAPQQPLAPSAFVDGGDRESASSDVDDVDVGESRGPPLIAEAVTRRRQRREQQLPGPAFPGVALPRPPYQGTLGGRPPPLYQQLPHLSPHALGGSPTMPATPPGFQPPPQQSMPGFPGAGPPSFAPPLGRPPAQQQSPGAHQGFAPGFAAPSFGMPTAPPLQAAGPPGPGQPMDMNTYVQYAMLQQLQQMGRKRDASGSEGSSDDDDKPDKATSSLRNVLRLRRRVRKHPLRIVTKYRQRCLDKAGIVVLDDGSLSSPFAHHHQSMRIRETFGKMVGLWRCHYAVARILEHLEHRRLEEGAATCCQLLKAIHETAIDHGSWNNSMLLLPWDDPLRPDMFGGDHDEMMAVAQWNRGVRDLQTQVASAARHSPHSGAQTGQEAEDGDHAGAAPGGRRPRGPRAKAKPPGTHQAGGGASAGG